MKDQLLLLLTGIVLAVFSWIFWSTTGQSGFMIIICLALLGTMADNLRLRRRLKLVEK